MPAATFNANRTTLQGVELGLSADLLQNVATTADKVTLSQLWNYSDFRFDNDPQYGNNRIAGVPEHVLRTTLAYSQASGCASRARSTGCRRAHSSTTRTR